MNPLFVEAAGAFVRWALAFAAGWFVQHGIWTASDTEKYVYAAAAGILALGWSLYQKYGMRLKLVTALATPGVMSENQVETKVAAGNSPSVTTMKTETPQ